MIEWFQTQQGQIGARFHHRALCSSRDPGKEGLLWAEAQEFLRSHSEVTIAGIGVGYHLIALAKKFPSLQITAFDLKEGWTLEIFPEELRNELQACTNLRMYFGESAVAEALKNLKGSVLTFPAACLEEEKQVARFLLGQDPQSFGQWAWRLGFHEFTQALENWPNDLAVNVKSLSLENLNPKKRETKILRVLKELVR